MIGYVLRRGLQLIPVLIVVSLVLFVLLRVVPGDPTQAVLGQEATAAQRAALREELGLDRSLPVQYWDWLSGAVTGDLGRSYVSDEFVLSLITERLPPTLELAGLALILAVVVGIPAGVLAAMRRGGLLDKAVNGVALLGLSVPHFYLAALLVLFVSVRLGALPASGFVGFSEDPVQNLRYMVLPTLTVGFSMAAVAMRQTRGAMLSALGEDYIRTARATGLPPRRVVGVYALRNAMVPVTSVLALQVGTLVSAAVITETIFTLPGMGSLIVDSILSRDAPVVQGAVLLVVVVVLLINLLADLIYAWLDPRITY